MVKARRALISSRLGQATMETVVILVVLVSVGLGVRTFMRDQNLFRSMVEGPWSPLRGMIESGVWRKHTVAPQFHPSQFNRYQTVRGETQ